MEQLRFETLGHSVIEKRNEGPNDFGPAWNLPTGFSSGGLSMELGLAEFGGGDFQLQLLAATDHMQLNSLVDEFDASSL